MWYFPKKIAILIVHVDSQVKKVMKSNLCQKK